MRAQRLPKLSIQEYLTQEQVSGIKYEYHDGKIYARAGGTLNHGLIGGNTHLAIGIELKKKGNNCLPFNSDVKLYIESTKSYVYPDGMVICGDIEESEEHKEAVKNPVLIVEVLSKSTAEYDRGDKFHLYRKIPSFKEYVLIEQRRHLVDVHYKQDNSDLWHITRYEGLDNLVKLHSLNIEVAMTDLYHRTIILPVEE